MQCLYRCPGNEVIWGIPIESRIVPAGDVAAYLKDGWHAHPHSARDAFEALKAEVDKEVAAEVVAEPEKRKPGRPAKA